MGAPRFQVIAVPSLSAPSTEPIGDDIIDALISEPPSDRPAAGPTVTGTLPLPEMVDTKKVLWGYAIGVAMVHALALLALLPYFFSWTGVVLALLGPYVFGTLGINICYHRLLTHQGFTCPKWLEHVFATLGVCCMQDAPARWVAIHRMHHQHSDERPDPHSPLVNFFWAHMQWIFVDNAFVNSVQMYDHYARDILRDPYYRRLQRNGFWMVVLAAQLVVFYGAGFCAGWWLEGTVMAGVQFGSSLLVWGVFVRTVAVWHITWSVNSLSHLWGYRSYETGDQSRNNWFVALIANGEGWHNNHHADQRSAAHGHAWWEFDVTWLTIRAMERVGLAKNVVLPSKRLPTKSILDEDTASVG